MKTKNVFRVALVTALILLVPLVAMQFTDEVNWELNDFVVMGILIFGTGLALDLVARKANERYRVAIGTAVVAAFLLIWVELAVGIFD